MLCSKRRSHPRGVVGWHVALRPSALPVALPTRSVAPYAVQGAAPSGRGSSPRIATQIRSGVSAYTPPKEPQVQPSWEWRSSGSGMGQPSTTR